MSNLFASGGGAVAFAVNTATKSSRVIFDFARMGQPFVPMAREKE